MTSARESLGWIIGSTLAGIGAVLSWFYESGFLGIIVSVAIGAGISLFVQNRTQKNEWKREYSIKVVEQVYSQLFGDIEGFITMKKRKEYHNWGFGFWSTAQKDHRYFMVDNKFRVRLDAFSQKVQKYDDTINKLDYVILPKIIKDATREIFHEEPHSNEQVTLGLSYKKGGDNIGTSLNLVSNLKRKQNLQDMLNYAMGVDAGRAEISNIELRMSFLKADRSQFESKDFDKIAMLWESCLKMIENIPEHQFIFTENDRLLEEAKEIKKELIKRIEEPWRI
jgi:hypothetical protein